MNGPNHQIRFSIPAVILQVVTSALMFPASIGFAYQGDRASEDLFPPSMKLASKAVRASTVTVRVDRTPTLQLLRSLSQEEEQDSDKSASQVAKSKRLVTVFSGVLVKQGFVAAPLFLPNSKNPEVRITLPDGEQTVGRPRILDEYSGLAIISIKDLTVPPLKCCESSEPVVGDWIVSGAAWGRENALISLGMISGIGYRVPNARIESPPMIVCDLRAAETSKGSGVVAANGKLIGIVMSVSGDQKWTYVVPSKHIHRLLRSLSQHEKKKDFSKDDILVLKRQVPRLGMRIDSIDWSEESRSYRLVVGSVVPKGPSDQAGLKKGDQIKSVNGKVVRSQYDVVRDFYNRQPGDKILMGIIRGKQKLETTLILGGGYKASGDAILKLKDYIKPEIDEARKKVKSVAESPVQPAFSQLVNYSIQNLAPTLCFDSVEIRELLDSLAREKSKNVELRSRVDLLENRLNQLIKKLDDK